MSKWLACLGVLQCLAGGMVVAAQTPTYDVVIYGGTAAGVAAGVQARRMGKTALIVGPDVHLGGLTAGGLGWTDSGNKQVVGGISREFYQRIKKHYDDPKAWRQQRQYCQPFTGRQWIASSKIMLDGSSEHVMVSPG